MHDIKHRQKVHVRNKPIEERHSKNMEKVHENQGPADVCVYVQSGHGAAAGTEGDRGGGEG